MKRTMGCLVLSLTLCTALSGCNDNKKQLTQQGAVEVIETMPDETEKGVDSTMNETNETTSKEIENEEIGTPTVEDSVNMDALCPEEISSRRDSVTYPEAIHTTYHSNATGLERGVNVLLPNGYTEEKKYPVLYVLHGIFGDEYTLINDSSCAFPQISTNMVLDGLAKEMIVVFPNMYATKDPELKPSFAPETVLPYDYFIYDLTEDLMPYINATYATLTDRENTAIAGFSMGGRESLFIGLQRPDLFGYVAAIAPAPGLTPGKDWAMTHPGQLAEEELRFKDGDPLPYFFMVCCGTNDGTVGKFPLSYHTILETNEVDHIWYEVPGADHDSTAIRSGIHNFMHNIFQQ